MDGQSKSIFTSVTFWGIALGLIGQIASRYGFQVDAAGAANDVVSLIGAGVALYGRIRATQPVHIIAPAAGDGSAQGGFARVGLLAVIALAFALAACAITPQTPAQAVYQIEADYAAALTVAVKYKQLPACGQPASPLLCANPPVIATLQKADDVAYAALSEAQTLIRTPGIGADKVQTAIATAVSALKVLTAVTSSLGVK